MVTLMMSKMLASLFPSSLAFLFSRMTHLATMKTARQNSAAQIAKVLKMSAFDINSACVTMGASYCVKMGEGHRDMCPDGLMPISQSSPRMAEIMTSTITARMT